MKKIWLFINELKIKNSTKNKLYISLLIAKYTLIGTGLWLAIGRQFLPGIDWLLCFIFYPALIVGYFGGVLYLYNHEFK